MNVELLRSIISEEDSMNVNDSHGIQNCWDREIAILTENLDETIKYLDSITDEREITYIAEIFEDISAFYKSKKLIDCLDRAEKRFPVHVVSMNVKYAKLFAVEND